MAAKLYVVTMVGPSCEQQVSTANASRLLDSQTKNTEPVAYKSLSEDAAIDRKTNAISQLKVSPLCDEVFAQKEAAPSDELLKIYDKFFATFFPGIDFQAFVQAASTGEDPDAYVQATFSPQQIQKAYDYLDTKQIPNTQSCSLAAADEALYMQAKTQYIQATDAGEATVAKMAFDTMSQIQSRVVCSAEVVQ